MVSKWELTRKGFRNRCQPAALHLCLTVGLPGCPCRAFQVQKRRKPLRWQARTVSGRTNHQHRAAVAPDAGQPDQQKLVPPASMWDFYRGMLKHADLVAQSQGLQLEGSPRTEHRGQGTRKCRERNEHRKRELCRSIILVSSDISRLSTATNPFASRLYGRRWRASHMQSGGNASGLVLIDARESFRQLQPQRYCEIFGLSCIALMSPFEAHNDFSLLQ